MVLKTSKVFIDTSAFKALVDSQDLFHKSAIKILNELINEGCELTTSNYIIDECLTLLRVKCSLESAIEFKKFLSNSKPEIKALRVKASHEFGAWKWFTKDWSKLSFTDCVSFAQMGELGIKRVFGFDNHFEKAGFVLEK